MIPYSTYKLIHLVSIMTFFLLATASFYFTEKSKKVAIALGVLSLVIFTGGMGLMARLGIAAQSWPVWIWVKIAVFLLVVGGAHMIAKRIPKPARIGIPFLLILFTIAAYMAINKPFS